MIDLNEVEILESNSVYRISDLVYRKGVRWQQDRVRVLTDPAHEDTILRDYLARRTEEDDLDTLRAIVRDHAERKSYAQPSSDELVLHLRLGDIMEPTRPGERRRLRRVHRMYQSFVDQVPVDRDDIGSATIVTALHFGANDINGKYFCSETAKERSFALLRRVERQLSDRGLEVGLKSSRNIDEDFVYMASSRHFVKGLTGLSDLIAECLEPRSECYALELPDEPRRTPRGR